MPVTDKTNRNLWRYLGTMLAVMALLYALPLFLVRSDLYAAWDPSFYARPLNYAFDTAGQNADVVIFGDSTALLGIDPSQVSSGLGVKVLNLPNTISTLSVVDDLTLRRYLSANRPPRLIVFYFAPWDFDYAHLRLNAALLYEGQELLARHGTAPQIYAYARHHVLDALAFPLRFWGAAWRSAEPRVSYRYQAAKLSATRGHIDNTDPTPLAATCRIPSFAIDNIRFDGVRSLAERFRSPQTGVLFFVAPVPSCTNAGLVLNRPYSQLPAAPPKLLPVEDFGSNVLYIHPRELAVQAVTQNLTDAIRPFITSTPGANTPAGGVSK